MHIGLIGGIGPAATEYYYRGLIDRYRAAGTWPDLTIVNADVRDLGRNLANEDAPAQAEIFARLTRRLQAAGAEAVAVTSMGGHFCAREFAVLSPLPIINAIPAVDAAIKQRGARTVGILGTMMVMRTRLYGGITAAACVVPAGEAMQRVHDAYIAMAGEGRVSDAQRAVFLSAGAQMTREQGADAIMLGGTDLFLAFDDADPGFPLIDCAAIHIDAIYQRSIASE
jgi:aspartate racemase